MPWSRRGLGLFFGIIIKNKIAYWRQKTKQIIHILKLKLITKTTNDVNLTIFYKFEVPSNKGIYTILEIMSERNKNFGRKDFSVFVEIK